MNPNDQNQNIDGIKTGDNPAPTSGVDGFVVPPKQPTLPQESADQDNFDQQTTGQETNFAEPQPSEKPKKEKSGRGVKVLLVIFIVLFAASAAAAGVFYMQGKQAKDDLATQQSKSSELQKQVDQLNSSSSKDQVEKLTTENANLQKTINAQKAYIASLTKVAQDLKTKCGTACSSIAIPPDTTSTTTTTTTP